MSFLAQERHPTGAIADEFSVQAEGQEVSSRLEARWVTVGLDKFIQTVEEDSLKSLKRKQNFDGFVALRAAYGDHPNFPAIEKKLRDNKYLAPRQLTAYAIPSLD